MVRADFAGTRQFRHPTIRLSPAEASTRSRRASAQPAGSIGLMERVHQIDGNPRSNCAPLVRTMASWLERPAPPTRPRV
jgi:hypothetical protein